MSHGARPALRQSCNNGRGAQDRLWKKGCERFLRGVSASKATESSLFARRLSTKCHSICGLATLASTVITITIIMPFSAHLSNNVDLPTH